MLHTDVTEQRSELEQLTTDRRVALRLLWLLDDPRAPLDEITRVISADPALSARVLAVANMPMFGWRTTTTVSRAVSTLGAQTIQTFAATAALQLFSMADSAVPESAWLHAVTAGVAAGRAAPQFGISSGEAFTTAVIQDIGVAMLCNRDADLFEEAQTLAERVPPRRLQIERETFGIDHAALAAQVLKERGLPDCIVEAVRDHHTADADASALARVVRVSDAVARVVNGDSPSAGDDLRDVLVRVGLNVSAEHLVKYAADDQRALLRFLGNFTGPTGKR